MGVKLAAASGGSIELVPTNTASNFTVTVPAGTAVMAIDGPAFSAYADGTTQTFASATYTKVLFQTEEFDTNSNFASSRFTPTVAGYYQVNAHSLFAFGVSGTGTCLVSIYKNGVLLKEGSRIYISANSSGAAVVSALIYLNGSTDYAEIYAQQASGTNQNLAGGNNQQLNYFQASMARGA